MKRFACIFLVLVLMLSLLTGCASQSEEAAVDTPDETPAATETITMRLAEVHAEGYSTTMGNREFARLVEERTDGRIKIEVYPGGVLGDEKSVTEQVQFGALDFARVSLAPVTEFEPSLNVLMLPYLYKDGDHMFRILNGDIGNQLLANLEENGIVGLAWYDGGARNFYNTQREIKSPEDMRGLQIRVQETRLMMDLITALGASPVPLPFGDVYSALQTGVIDGAENNWPSYDSTGHYEVAKYFTVDEHIRIPEILMTNTKVMESLSAEDQEIIRQAAREAGEYQRTLWLQSEEESKQKVIDAGSVITYLESNEEFQEAVMPLYETHGAGYGDIIEAIINTN
ncbi:tripartite ATP-independent transporter solute receptor, DctP family [Natronincola peptidivorans]|uniref:Tripartite ATP-independent transporter solute receptor, DctP family n=1 Tax=Natronincola peptidivorans TaxID=426128 RepID=A0A1I0G668_9FIRM|nr:TRAP transporter substrate-binding protein [Natronincola peptidivorans]SET66150.1 tripartite ATP-independent transporter solute receptor, DctP family [Natronincola peptidivorans]